jgi:hypothetical protein
MIHPGQQQSLQQPPGVALLRRVHAETQVIPKSPSVGYFVEHSFIGHGSWAEDEKFDYGPVVAGPKIQNSKARDIGPRNLNPMSKSSFNLCDTLLYAKKNLFISDATYMV